MKVKLIVVGKTKKSFLTEGEKEYQKRLRRYLDVELIELADVKNAKKRSEEEIKREESKAILSKITTSDYVELLDEQGKQYTSVKFAKHLEHHFVRGGQTLVFVVGGPYGFHEDVYQRANDKLSLSKLTFSHQMVRLFFIEQLYRAMTILKGEPYHHQ
jgi:23S rRNA (pseudouridine1915-N3)-methyltransferase